MAKKFLEKYNLLIPAALLVLFCGKLTGGVIPDSVAARFIDCLFNDDSAVEELIYPEEKELSERLNISYSGVNNKPLIGQIPDENTLNGIHSGKLKYSYSISKIDDEYSRLNLEISNTRYKTEFIFRNGKLVSKPYYASRKWKQKNTKYFRFFISDTSLTNAYALNKLDDFVDSLGHILDLTEEDFSNLSRNKILYFFCRNEDEVEKLTGYKARGMYLLGYDYLVSAYNCHFHELAHLLINFKLKNLPLYTQPFLQEGFAVAYGGRGGKDPAVILEMGKFICKSGFGSKDDLISKIKFSAVDPTISYPVSGLYCKFLIKQKGIGEFLKLYLKYSGNENELNKMEISAGDLPSDENWEKYLEKDAEFIPVKFPDINSMQEYGNKIFYDDNNEIFEAGPDYLFEIKDTILISDEIFPEYVSSQFDEIVKKKNYHSEKYIVFASANEVSVYNLFTNSLIAKYVSSFDEKMRTVPAKNEKFYFLVNGKIFGKNLENCKIYKIGDK